MMRKVVTKGLLAALLAGCATVSPGDGPATYRALGTEPFWNLTLTGREMVFTEANAPGARIAEAQPRAIHGFAGDIYNGRRIGLNIVRGVGCSDGMSDRRYPDRVQVRVDGRSFEGCGGEVPMPSSLAGTSWAVVSVNGRATGGGERFQLRFEEQRWSGAFGCNRMFGGYAFNGRRFETRGPVGATQMACPDMRFEEEAGRILQGEAEARWGDGDRLTLSNAAGSMVLQRVI